LHENERFRKRRSSLTLPSQNFKTSAFLNFSAEKDFLNQPFLLLPFSALRKPILPSPFPSPTLPSEGKCPAMGERAINSWLNSMWLFALWIFASLFEIPGLI